MKTVVLVGAKDDVTAASPCLVEDEGVKFIATDWRAFEELDSRGVPYDLLEDYLSSEAFEAITKKAFDWCGAWYNHIDNLIFDGIPIGKALEHSLYYYFIYIMKAVDVSCELINREKPDRSVLISRKHSVIKDILIDGDEDLFTDIYVNVAKKMGVKCEVLSNGSRSGRQGIVLRIREAIGLFKSKSYMAIYTLKRRLKKSFSALGKGPIVSFVSYECSVNKLIKPVIDSLKKHGRCRIFILSKSNRYFGSSLIKNVEFLCISDFVSKEEKNDIENRFNLLRKELLQKGLLENVFVYRGIDLWPMMKERFEFAITKKFPELAVIARGMKNIHFKEKLNAVVVANEVKDVFRVSVLTANILKIPSLIILHGMPTEKYPYFPGIEPFLADKMASFGEGCNKVLIGQGVDPRKLVVTGAPMFDKYIAFIKSGMKSDIKKMSKLGLSCDKKLIIFATDRLNHGRHAYGITYSFRDRFDMFRDVVKAVAAFPEARLVIKPKMGDENVGLLKYIIKKYGKGDEVILGENFAMTGIFSICDIMITCYSTIGLETMIFGKPVIVVRPPNSIAKVADHSSGAALLAESKEDVIKSIKMFLYDTAAKARINNFAEEFVKKYAYTQDGKASARAAELIESMACGQMMCSPTGSLENEPINHLGVAV